nr:hypothetical protein [uncultured Mucilaginibacter sp.]
MTIKQSLVLMAFAGIALASCQSKTTPPAADSAATVSGIDPKDILSVDTAKQYVGNYKAGTVDSIASDGKPVPVPNSRTVWFPKAKLQAMLANMEKENGDGVRFYFAAYPAKLGGTANNPDPRYLGYNTLIMVSTVPKDTLGQKGLHWDSYTKQGVSNSSGPLIIVGGTAGPENRGEICPPPSNCPALGATLIQ